MHNRQIDAYSTEGLGGPIAIEVTEQKSINKIQDDINKLVAVRNANFAQQFGFKSTKCIIVTGFDPTVAMRGACASISVDIYSIDEFRNLFLPFEEYREARQRKPFGSAVDPKTGVPDTRQYVKVDLITANETTLSGDEVAERLSDGRKLAVIGEYGTGKSKLFEYVFGVLADGARSCPHNGVPFVGPS